MTNPDLHNCIFTAWFHRTITNVEGNLIDMYLLVDDRDGEGIVSIGVPHKRDDIIKFIVRSCAAGQKVLNTFNITNIDDFKP